MWRLAVIGIMADSHDNLIRIRQAVRVFTANDCDLVVHAGDFVAPFSAGELQDLNCPIKAVFGNCDGEKHGLQTIIEPLGMIKEAPFAFEHRGLRFILAHFNSSLKSYLAGGGFDVLIFGHTHKPEIRKEKKTLLINPGETGGWVTGKSSLALLDPARLTAEIVFL
jgi:putative phosphoesterase